MNRFAYHQPQAYSYAKIDPVKYRFADTPHFRPPTPPILSPPKDPNAPEEPEKTEEPIGDEGTKDAKLESTEGNPSGEFGIVKDNDALPAESSLKEGKEKSLEGDADSDIIEIIEEAPPPPPSAPNPPSMFGNKDKKEKKRKSSEKKQPKEKPEKAEKSTTFRKWSKPAATSNVPSLPDDTVLNSPPPVPSPADVAPPPKADDKTPKDPPATDLPSVSSEQTPPTPASADEDGHAAEAATLLPAPVEPLSAPKEESPPPPPPSPPAEPVSLPSKSEPAHEASEESLPPPPPHVEMRVPDPEDNNVVQSGEASAIEIVEQSEQTLEALQAADEEMPPPPPPVAPSPPAPAVAPKKGKSMKAKEIKGKEKKPSQKSEPKKIKEAKLISDHNKKKEKEKEKEAKKELKANKIKKTEKVPALVSIPVEAPASIEEPPPPPLEKEAQPEAEPAKAEPLKAAFENLAENSPGLEQVAETSVAAETGKPELKSLGMLVTDVDAMQPELKPVGKSMEDAKGDGHEADVEGKVSEDVKAVKPDPEPSKEPAEEIKADQPKPETLPKSIEGLDEDRSELDKPSSKQASTASDSAPETLVQDAPSPIESIKPESEVPEPAESPEAGITDAGLQKDTFESHQETTVESVSQAAAESLAGAEKVNAADGETPTATTSHKVDKTVPAASTSENEPKRPISKGEEVPGGWPDEEPPLEVAGTRDSAHSSNTVAVSEVLESGVSEKNLGADDEKKLPKDEIHTDSLMPVPTSDLKGDNADAGNAPTHDVSEDKAPVIDDARSEVPGTVDVGVSLVAEAALSAEDKKCFGGPTTADNSAPTNIEPEANNKILEEELVDPTSHDSKEDEVTERPEATGSTGETDLSRSVDEPHAMTEANPDGTVDPNVQEPESKNKSQEAEQASLEPQSGSILVAADHEEPATDENAAPNAEPETAPAEAKNGNVSVEASDGKAAHESEGANPVDAPEMAEPTFRAEEAEQAIEAGSAEHAAPGGEDAWHGSKDLAILEGQENLEEVPSSPTTYKRYSHASGEERPHRYKMSSKSTMDGSHSYRRRRESHGSGSTSRSKETEDMLALAKVHKISRRHTTRKDERSDRSDDASRHVSTSSIREGQRPEEKDAPRSRLLDLSTPKSDTGLLLRINKDRKEKDLALSRPRVRRTEHSVFESDVQQRRDRPRRREYDSPPEDDQEARREHRRRRRRESTEAYEQASEELRRKRKELERAQEAAAKAHERKKDREKLYHYEKAKESSGGSRSLRESMTRGMKMLFAS